MTWRQQINKPKNKEQKVLPAGGSHDAFLLRTAALGIIIMFHAKVMSYLVSNRCGYQRNQTIIILRKGSMGRANLYLQTQTSVT